MIPSRRLWVSVVFVVVLASASLAGLVTGRLSPVLGLDLQGGVSVILSAPDGTPTEVMDRALENIRGRVDAFGVGEPEIFVSGTTIEVQIPGLSESTVEPRTVNLSCLTGAEDINHGCAEDAETARVALSGVDVTGFPSEVCLVSGDADLECYPSLADAQIALGSLTVAPKTEATPTPTPAASPTPVVGPEPAPDTYCIVDAAGTELACPGSRSETQDALEAVETDVRSRAWCLLPPSPEPSPTPDPAATLTPTATPPASPALTPDQAFAQLDVSSATALPCNLDTKATAEEALAAITVVPVSTQFCVVSSVGEDLGCFLDQTQASTRQRETGQERLLSVIGQTARLEERQTLEIISPQDPRYATTEVTCDTEQEQETLECTGSSLDSQNVVYFDRSGSKVRLGPVVIAGGNIDSSRAVLSGGTPEQPISQWVVTFDLDGDGRDKFAQATTVAASAPPPQNQIAIVVDRTIVSNPVVQEPITQGTGQITGDFEEADAKDLATLLNAGALPVELTREAVRTVSPTLGEESLREGIVAGIAGLILLSLYLLVYYRLLGVVAWFGMSIWAILALMIVSVAGERFGYALTLAGVAGLVISLGVAADSYIVFFERLKDEMHHGRSARAVVQPAFKRSFRTIVAADVVTGIAAAVLYVTAISSVRGFALTLGVATLLDLFVVYFFKRPVVMLVARSRRLVEMRGFGLTSATAADHGAIDTGAGPGG